MAASSLLVNMYILANLFFYVNSFEKVFNLFCYKFLIWQYLTLFFNCDNIFLGEIMDFIKTGDYVTIQNCKTKETKTFELVKFKKEIVPVWTYNTKNNAARNHYSSKIVSDADGVNAVSVDTPIGKACYGKKVNDIIECKTLKGNERYIILSIQKGDKL